MYERLTIRFKKYERIYMTLYSTLIYWEEEIFFCSLNFYTENLDLNDKKSELPIGVSCRTCDRLDCSQRAFPPLHKKFDIDINSRGVSVYVGDKNS